MGIGLYIHVPFCRQKCAYCDFYSIDVHTEAVDAYLEAVLQEAQLRGTGQKVHTVFFGGGTPSLLTARQISTVLEGISRYFCLSTVSEVTLEANPETLTADTVAAYRRAGINRFSIGIQTLQPQLLHRLGRRHTAAAALQAIDQIRAAGFSNYSCDLIYGIPGQTLADWQHDLQLLVAKGLPHLSVYSLEIYEQTPLGQALAAGEIEAPDEDLAADMYEWACSYLPEQGLLQYEISNFARVGSECLHNLNYWCNGEYLGLGTAACSYWQGERTCNLPNLAAYQRSLAQGVLPLGSSERLDEPDAAAETVILGLRLNRGVDGAAFAERFGYTLETQFGPVLQELLQRQWLIRTPDGYALAPAMRPLANLVFTRFLSDSNT